MPIFRVIPAGDLALKNGSPYLIEGPAYTRQKLSARFKFFKREWFLNRLEGMPYYELVLVHNPDLDVIKSLFRRVTLECPGIVSMSKYSMSFDRAKRRALFGFKAKCADGEFEVKPGDQDFIVDLSRG